MLFKTAAVFLLLILIIAILTFFPLISFYFNYHNQIFFDNLYLFLGFFIILFLLYKIIPDVHVHIADIIKGAACASLLIVILLGILQVYFSYADYTAVYGALASITVILISFTLIAEMIYIGMYVMFEAHMKRLIDELRGQMAKEKAEPQA